MRWVGLSLISVMVAACGTAPTTTAKRTHGKEYFSEKEYGVKASPRVANGKNIPKGGGRYLVGNPYVVKGKTYYPKEDFSYNKVGIASWYGSAFHGRLTANGEVYDQMSISAAHPTFPLPSYARVTNVENGSSIIVRVNDRGPYHEGRIIDLSDKTADMLDLRRSGTGNVRVQYVGKARMDGYDMPYLMASYVPKGSRIPGVSPGEGQIASGVMVASNSKRITRDEIQSFGGFTPPAEDSVPVPRSATSYAGSTPSEPYAAAVPTPLRTPSFDNAAPASFDEVVVLPEVGPYPYERPYGWQQGSMVMGYQEEGVKTVAVGLAFDAVMVRNDGLTEESILASFKRQQAAKSALK